MVPQQSWCCGHPGAFLLTGGRLVLGLGRVALVFLGASLMLKICECTSGFGLKIFNFENREMQRGDCGGGGRSSPRPVQPPSKVNMK